MTNELMFHELINRYDRIAYTHHYIFGFADRGTIYAAYCEADMLPYICTLDRTASNRGGYFSLRFKPNKEQKELLKTCRLEVICSEDYMEEQFEQLKWNRGDIFEKIMTERAGQVWVKNNLPFTDGPDLATEEGEFQIKFNKATFCDEKSIVNLERHVAKRNQK